MVYGQVALLADAVSTVPTVGADWATPAFIAALATLITAITGLVVALGIGRTARATQTVVHETAGKVSATQGAVNEVARLTNGVQDALTNRVGALEDRATPPGMTPPSPAGPLPPAMPPPVPG